MAEGLADETGASKDIQVISKLLKDYQLQQEREKDDLVKVILEKLQEDSLGTASVVNTFSMASTSTLGAAAPTVTISALSLNSNSRWTFTQGLIIGQVSVIILLCAFIKFFVFTEASPIQAPPVKITKAGEVPDITAASMGPSLSTKSRDDQDTGSDVLRQILEKTYYDVNKHQPESLDWFNVLIAQIISQGRFEALVNDNIHNSITEALNHPTVLQYCDGMKVTEINIGNDYPIFSNCRVRNNEGRLEAKIDVDVADTVTLGLETNLLINQPRFMSACLPIKLRVSLVRFSSCLTVSLVATNKDAEDEKGATGNGQSIGLMFAFSPDFRMEFDVKSLIGSKAKLENIPRISSMVENAMRKWFIDRCIEPRFQLIKLPSLWPRKKNTRVEE